MYALCSSREKLGVDNCDSNSLKELMYHHFIEVIHSINCISFTSGGFPGSQPVSMDKQNVQLLTKKPYRVSWKADGVRYNY